MRLQGKVAIITGGTRGLGRAIAERFLEEGASVVCASRNPHDCGELTARTSDQIAFHAVDVSDQNSVAELMSFADSHFGKVDILVSNAGVNHDNLIEHISLQQWDEMVATNLTGTYLCAQEAVAYLQESGAGRVINISSVLASRATIGAAGYCATKAAVEMLTKVAAIEFASKGILVNCISPGYIDAGMGKDVESNSKIWPNYRRRLALGRPGRADEVADAAVFLAGPESTYINGHVLEVNGGLRWA